MISLIIGENTFENERSLERLIADFDGVSERIDGETLELKQLPDLIMGASLFASHRLVIIKNLSSNKSLWSVFEEWIPRVSDEIHVVLVETKPDKRTKTFKVLQKTARLYESKLWTERDGYVAEQWAVEEASRLGMKLDKKNAHLLVQRTGVDQWAVWQALQKLAVLDEITSEVIEKIIERQPTENAFGLFEAALRGDGEKVKGMLASLQATEDIYRLFGLLNGQAFQLVTFSVADVPDKVVAGDLGIHPFVATKLSPLAKKIGPEGGRTILRAFVEADTALKTSATNPWLLLERALMKTVRAAR